MKSLLTFIKYNNVVPMALGAVLFGGASAFAATDPQAIFNSQQEVLTIDNTYIANKDLAQWSPQIGISNVTEDDANYYVAYRFNTIDVKDYVWQDVAKGETMAVSKADLGPYRDLGVYVTAQFKNIISNELAYLTNVQSKARAQTSQKTVATTYGGLVGQFLTDKTEVLPGYVPVVTPPDQSIPGGNSGNAASAVLGAGTQPVSVSGGGPQIGIQVLGNNPARVALRSAYVDLGAVLIDPLNTNVGIYIYMHGQKIDSLNIDTSTSTSYAVEYHATDRNGVEVVARRIIIVGDAPDPGGEVTLAGATNSVVAPAPSFAPVQQTIETAASAPTATGTSTPPIDAMSADQTISTTTDTTGQAASSATP